MASKIKGITIEIGGDVQPLNKALEGVNKKSRDLQSELRQVERLLKLDPGNTELLAQKQELLTKAVENSREKLETLRKAQQQVEEQFKKGDIGEEQYRAFQRELIKAEQELQRFEKRLQSSGNETKTFKDKLEEAGKTVKEVGEKIKSIGKTMSTTVTAPIVGGFAALTAGTKEFRSDLSRLEANAEVAGQKMDVLNDAMATLHAVTGETDSSVEGLSNLLATGFRDEQLTELLDSLYGAAIKFSDTLKFEGIADGLQETLATGEAVGPFAELLERSGIALDSFNEGLQQAIANGEQENYILQTLAQTGLAETYEAWRKNNEEMVKTEEANFRMQQAFAELGASLEPILRPIIEKVTELVNKFNEMSPTSQRVILVIAGIAAAIGPLLVAFGSVATAVSTLTSLFIKVGAAIGAISAPVAIAVAAVAGLIAVGVALYKNWDEIKEKAIELKDNLQETWENIKNIIAEAWNSIWTTTTETWITINSWLTNLWNGIKNTVVTTWNSILTTITDILNKVKGKFQSLVDSAKDWGKNLMNEFIDGFKSMFGKLWNALEDAANAVAGFLGFHSPTKLGPGRDADKWAPNLVKMYAEGIKKTLPRLQSALNEMASSLTPANIAGNTNYNYNSGGNTFNIYVQGTSAEEVLEKLKREVHKIGERW